MKDKLIVFDPKILRKPGPDGIRPDDFAIQKIMPALSPTKQYLIDGQWTLSMLEGQKPQEVRATLPLERFRAGREVYFAWRDLINIKVDNPVNPERALERLTESRLSQKPVTLFVPWGVRPKGQPRLEEKVLDQLSSVQQLLLQRNIPTTVMIMPADVYATEVNRQVKPEQAEGYFSFITRLAQLKGFQVKPWSEIRAENYSAYSARSEKLTEPQLEELLGFVTVQECVAAAKRRSGFYFEDEIRRSAFAYMRERVCEAEIIESIYQPIKVSAVTKNKDNAVDRQLPRIYVIPDAIRYPWLK